MTIELRIPVGDFATELIDYFIFKCIDLEFNYTEEYIIIKFNGEKENNEEKDPKESKENETASPEVEGKRVLLGLP